MLTAIGQGGTRRVLSEESAYMSLRDMWKLSNMKFTSASASDVCQLMQDFPTENIIVVKRLIQQGLAGERSGGVLPKVLPERTVATDDRTRQQSVRETSC